MYATWKSYQSVTAMGINKEILKFDPPVSLEMQPYSKLCWLSSPSDTLKNRAYFSWNNDGSVENGGPISSLATRPALY